MSLKEDVTQSRGFVAHDIKMEPIGELKSVVGGWIGTPAPESDLEGAVIRGIADMEKLAL